MYNCWLSVNTVVNTSIGNAIMPTKLSDDSETDLNEDNGQKYYFIDNQHTDENESMGT